MKISKKKYNGRGLSTLLLLALCSEFAYVGLAAIQDFKQKIPAFMGLFFVCFAAYWLAAHLFFGLNETVSKRKWAWQQWRLERFSWLNDFIFSGNRPELLAGRHTLLIGLIFGIIFRLTIIGSTPSLSDDIYRYIWDGKVANVGINPYLYEPQNPALNHLRDQQIYPNINHKEIPTVYPPVTQATFRTLAMISPTVLTFKLGFLFFDLLTVAALYLILNLLKIDRRRILIYLWNPLIILEFSGSGHSDIIGVSLLCFALYYLIKKRFTASAGILALSTLTKFIALFYLPVIMLFKRQQKMATPLLLLAICAACYLPFAEAGGAIFSGLVTYAGKWEFNGSVFPFMVAAIEKLTPESWIIHLLIEPLKQVATEETIVSRTTDFAIWVAKALTFAAFAGIVIYFLRRFNEDVKREGESWIFKIGLIFFGTFAILNSTVHPWYLSWLVPFLVIAPNRAWILLTGLSVLSYWALIEYTATGVWRESVAIRLFEYLPFYFLLITDYLRKHAVGGLKKKTPATAILN